MPLSGEIVEHLPIKQRHRSRHPPRATGWGVNFKNVHTNYRTLSRAHGIESRTLFLIGAAIILTGLLLAASSHLLRRRNQPLRSVV